MVFGKLRENYEKATRPMGQVLAKTRLPPHAFTIFSLLVAVVSGYEYSLGRLVEASFFLVLSAIVDMFDGSVARATGKVTKFGAVFDHVLDRYAEFFVIFGMVYSGYVAWTVGLFSLIGMIMASFTRAKAESVGGLKSCTVGIAERQEKLLLLIGGSIVSFYYPVVLGYAVLLVGILSQITVLQRLHYTWVQLGGK